VAAAETAHSLLRIAKGGAPASSISKPNPPLAWATRPGVRRKPLAALMDGRYNSPMLVPESSATVAPWYLIPLLTGVVSFLAAWLGGFLGVKRDAEKMAKQRAFDSRLEWYVRMARSLAEFDFLHRRLRNSDPKDRDELSAACHDAGKR
jgi:hypothetical protein